MALIKTSLPPGDGTVATKPKGIVCLDSNPVANAGVLTCDGVNPGAATVPATVIYTVKLRWTDTSNTTQVLMAQTIVNN
jgi:hypothetical protein